MSAEIREIPLTQGKVALVDADRYDELMQFRWHAVNCKVWYAAITLPKLNGPGRGRRVYMHQMLMGFPKCKVDHRDGNTLRNLMQNLRLATNADSARNRRSNPGASGYLGVYWEDSSRRWVATITVDYRLIKIGRFATAEQAAKARDEGCDPSSRRFCRS